MNVLSMFVLNLFHAKLKVTHCGILNGMKAMQKVQHTQKKTKTKNGSCGNDIDCILSLTLTKQSFMLMPVCTFVRVCVYSASF